MSSPFFLISSTLCARAVAAIYFALCWPLSLVAAGIERRHRKALAR